MATIIHIFALVLLLLSSSLFAQKRPVIEPIEHLWAVNANFGYSLLWGDAGSQNPNPFARWFSSEEAAFSYGLNVHRKLNNTFKLQGGLIYGNLNSYRPTSDWSKTDPLHANISAKTTYVDGHIDLIFDFTSMFGFKPDRLVSFYGIFGVGAAYYNAQSKIIYNYFIYNTYFTLFC